MQNIQYGEIQENESTEDSTKNKTIKLRHGLPFLEECIYKERIQVMRITDLDTIIAEMHTKHALDEQYGAWLEKAKDGRLYVIKYSVAIKRGNQ